MDTTLTIDLAPSSTFQPTYTFTLGPGDFYNWPDDNELWIRVTPPQNPGTAINVWIHPGANAAPPVSVNANVTGGGVNATSIQGFPVSTTAPNTGQALVFNGTLYVPTTVLQAVTAGTGISVGGSTIDPTITNTGVLSLTAGTNITLGGTAQNPTINSTASGGTGTVTSITAGGGILLTPNPITNTGVIKANLPITNPAVNLAGSDLLIGTNVTGFANILTMSLGAGNYLCMFTVTLYCSSGGGSSGEVFMSTSNGSITWAGTLTGAQYSNLQASGSGGPWSSFFCWGILEFGGGTVYAGVQINQMSGSLYAKSSQFTYNTQLAAFQLA